MWRLAVVVFVVGFAILSTQRFSQADIELRSLEKIPGISSEVLSAQGKAIRIATPVSWFPKSNVALFEVTILDEQRFRNERDYAFIGDARLLENFVREIRFVQAKADANIVAASGEQAARGATEAIESLVSGIWNVFRHPVETVKQVWGGAAGVVDYAKLVAQGKVSPGEDARDFAEAFYVDQCVTVGKEGGFDFLQAQTPEAIALTQQLAKPRIVGEIGAHVLSLFAPVALFKAARGAKLVEAASAARGVGELAVTGRALRAGGHGAEKLAAFGKALANGEAAAATLAHSAKLAQAEQSLRSLTIVKALVHPAKLRTLEGRALNPRLHKLLLHLHDAERKGVDAGELVRQAMVETGKGGEALRFVDAEIDAQQVLLTLRQAKEWGIFDDAANLDKMRRGQAPIIKVGPNAGSKVGVDHLVHVSLAPEISNRFGNLRYLPDGMNKSRGNRVDPDMLAKLQEYRNRGHLEQTRIDEIIAARLN